MTDKLAADAWLDVSIPPIGLRPSLYEAFAAHRIAGERAGLEKAAKVVESGMYNSRGQAQPALVAAIRNSSPTPLELLATMRGSTLIEGFAHQWFCHLRRHGEWFEDDGEIRAKILQFTKEPFRGVVIPPDSSLFNCVLRPLSMAGAA